MKKLAKLLDDYLSKNPRINPSEEHDPGTELDMFIGELKSKGVRVGSYSENEWINAILRLGHTELEAASVMEQVASWGVDE